MRIGYARTSTHEQNLDLQINALKKANCKKIFTDQPSGPSVDRSGLESALSHLRKGDVLVVWNLDRLGRNVKGLIELIGSLQSKENDFISLSDAIDTTTPAGKFFFHVMASLAQMERALNAERSKAGLKAARKSGRVGGRPRKMTNAKIDMAINLLADGVSTPDVAKTLHVSVSTLYRWLSAENLAQLRNSSSDVLSEKKTSNPSQKLMRVKLYLRVENNNKFVRGKKKSRQEIEDFCLSQYDMKKITDWDYELSIPYDSDEDLDRTVYDILSESASHADSRNCFIEADVWSLDDPERAW